MDEFIDDRDPTPGDDPPVTAVASRRVKRRDAGCGLPSGQEGGY
jgi:hypothetical protein